MDFIAKFRAARRAAAPLVAVLSPDQLATLEAVRASFNGSAPPLFSHDIVRGISALNQTAQEALFEVAGDTPSLTTSNPVEALQAAVRLPPKSLLFLFNAHRLAQDPGWSQALLNLRDDFKASRRQAVLLGPGFQLPTELQTQVVTLDEALPSPERRERMVLDLWQSIREAAPELPEQPPSPLLASAVDSTSGMPLFQAETAVAMSLDRDAGISVPTLRDLQRTTLGQVPGFSLPRLTDTYADIGGSDQLKSFILAVLAGKAGLRFILFIDEIEKALAGSAPGDRASSDVGARVLGRLLIWMQDSGAVGIILLGPPGCAKSAIGKATGPTAGLQTGIVDIPGLRGGIVGQTEQNTAMLFKTVDGISNGPPLVIATCNRIDSLPPELRRRFNLGIWYCDLPTDDEKARIWPIYERKYGIDPSDPRPSATNWTGAEIRQCSFLAWSLGCTRAEAARFIVPVASQMGPDLERLRQAANGRYLSAAYPGPYQLNRSTQQPAGRLLDM